MYILFKDFLILFSFFVTIGRFTFIIIIPYNQPRNLWVQSFRL